MKSVLYSKKDVLAELDGEIYELSISKPLVVEEEEIIKIFPNQKNCLPFCIIINERCEYLKCTSFNTFKMFEIVYFPEILSGEFFLTKTFKNISASVVGKPFRFNVVCEGLYFSHCFSIAPQNIHLFDAEHSIVLQGEYEGKNCVVMFHKKTKKFYEFWGDIELSNKKLKALINKKTMAGHGEILEYEISNDDFKLVEKDSVYLYKKPQNMAPFLSHIAFFEAIKEKDYNLAKTYLTEDFANKITIEHLESFFGDFDCFKVMKKNENLQIAIIKNISEQNAEGKLFSLKFSNGKIEDIFEE